jgi:hypothetical protein
LKEIEFPNSNYRAFTGYEPKFLGCILHALIISVASILGIGKDVVVANLGNNALIVTVILSGSIVQRERLEINTISPS